MKKTPHQVEQGFALVATICILSLGVVMALAMLSLATTTAQGGLHTRHLDIAQANARLALTEAIAQLQRYHGRDQTVCADASIFDVDPSTTKVEGVKHPHLLGIWQSWSPDFGLDPLQEAPNYKVEKRKRFQKWLVSHPDVSKTTEFGYAIDGQNAQHSPHGSVVLYDELSSGFSVHSPLVNINGGGHYAWHIAQEGSKAKVNTASPFNQKTNDQLVAPSQIGYSIHPSFNQVELENEGAKFVCFDQIDLSSGLKHQDYQRPLVYPHFTVHSRGLLIDVVKGGFKKDLSLAFELNDREFCSEFNSPITNYTNELPLFEPLVKEPVAIISDPYGPLTYQHELKCNSTPTFQTLRSHYRLYKNIYLSNEDPTVFQRPKSHISWPLASGLNHGKKTETSVMPILNRFMLLNQMGLDQSGLPQYVLTPLVSMWNPYNVAVETEGFEIYPWLDYPVELKWRGVDPSTGQKRWEERAWLSVFLSDGSSGQGRQTNPYFYLYLTQNGSLSGEQEPIRFEPGEVKVFSLVDFEPKIFKRTGTKAEKSFHMKPVDSPADLNIFGGIQIPMNTALPNHGRNNVRNRVIAGEKYGVFCRFNTNGAFRSSISVRDLGEQYERTPVDIASIQMFGASGLSEGDQQLNSVNAAGDLARATGELTLLCVQESFFRTARVSTTGNEPSDMFYSVNPRQEIMSRLISGTADPKFPIAPNVMLIQRATNDFATTGFQTNAQGSQSYYGESNSVATGGRTHVVAFEIPHTAPMNIASLQHADVSNSVFNPAMQIANSYASPYLPKTSVAAIQSIAEGGKPILPNGVPIYDTSYLSNEALWDSYYFSSAAPVGGPTLANGTCDIWENEQFEESISLKEVLRQFIEDFNTYPLRNKRMQLKPSTKADILTALCSASGYKSFASHLTVDGMFNVNSTSKEAWKAFLASTRGLVFSENTTESGLTPLVRMHHPSGVVNDPWDGFRQLTDQELDTLAGNLVKQVKLRGPFLSLAEFINRRVEDSDFGTQGVIQSAIDATATLNNTFEYANVDPSIYPYPESYAKHKTGVGTPGYLMQADVLSAIGTSINVRSDTFIIRTYGDSRDSDNTIKATAYCEAVVQRQHSFVDASQPSMTNVSDLNTHNATYGRKFSIVQFQWLNRNEVK